MSYYVRRHSPEGRQGFTGPLSIVQAIAEVGAWERAGWTASREPASPELLEEVRAWERDVAQEILAHQPV